MRRVIFTILCVASIVLFSTTEASAQIDLGKALGVLLGGATESQSQRPDPYAELAANAPERSKIQGTWQYKSARVEYLGVNPLASAALDQVEGAIAAGLKNNGIVEGCCSLTLRRNGIFVIGTLDSVQDGTYSYDDATARITITSQYDGIEYSAKGYLKMISGRLVAMLDAKDVLREIVRENPTLATDESFAMIYSVIDSFGDTYVSIMFGR